MEHQSSTGLVVAYTEAQSMALNNARITLLRAAEIVPSENASFEIQAAGRVALEIFNCVEVSSICSPSKILAQFTLSARRQQK